MKKPVSINDLKDLEFNGKVLTPQQRLAIRNFDRHRFRILSGIKNEEKFHAEFQKLQVQANLSDYSEFLSESYIR